MGVEGVGMTRIMYDAVDPNHIPKGAAIVAGYIGGAWPTFSRLALMFPNAVKVSIAVNATHDADVLDVEQGDATPAQAPEWVLRQRILGGVPTVYCSTSVWASVVRAFEAEKVALPLWWEAHYDGKPVLSPNSVAKQYTDGITPSNAPNRVPGCDTSVVADYWPGVDKAPTHPIPGPAQPAPEEDPMATVFVTPGPNSPWYITDGFRKKLVAPGMDKKYVAWGVVAKDTVSVVDPNDLNTIPDA
jgi:hypothetical protein